MSNKKKITISGVLEMLKDGKKRPEIAEELGITMAECTKLFQHPKLKGKKALKPVSFELVDDTEEAVEEIAQSNGPGIVEDTAELQQEAEATQTEIEVEQEAPIFTPSFTNN